MQRSSVSGQVSAKKNDTIKKARLNSAAKFKKNVIDKLIFSGDMQI